MRALRALLVTLLLGAGLSGCLDDGPGPSTPPAGGAVPSLAYQVPEPDLSLDLLEEEALVDAGDVDIHVRIKRPAGMDGVPVIVQFTPYTAGAGSVGQNPVLNQLAEPAGCAVIAGDCESNFDVQFVRRGYAFAYGDVRGTGDSSGCLSLRGPEDIADAGKLIEWLGTREWSNGWVGFIGASYPGSEAHIAAIAEAGARTGHLGAVIPVVASTSFYHYHHNDGVPYNGNHALGGTNTGYTQNAVAPTINPQNPNFVGKYVEELTCPTADNVVEHGGLDQTGAYYQWWQDRNLRAHGRNVTVPVLMAQGLADWNVKPDHIAHYYNDIPTQKTLLAGQWAHQYPRSDGDCAAYDPGSPGTSTAPGRPPCDPNIPWGDWWEYATAFFDTYLKRIDTGMFEGDVAWVQDNAGQWHRSASWPLPAGERSSMTWHLQPGGFLTGVPYAGGSTDDSWFACPHDQLNRGTPAGAVEEQVREQECTSENLVEQLVFESTPFTQDTILSGVPLVNLTLSSSADSTHLVAVLEVVRKDGSVARENYGYLNPAFRDGLKPTADALPDGQYKVSLDLYPQEDVVKAGERVRLTVRSNDEGRTIESYAPGTNTLHFAPELQNSLWLPTRPAALQGVRLG